MKPETSAFSLSPSRRADQGSQSPSRAPTTDRGLDYTTPAQKAKDRSTLVGKRQPLDRVKIVALPVLEDRLSVQLAISEVVNALACNFIDAKRANSQASV